MAVKSRAREAKALVVPDDLADVVREAITNAGALKASSLKKALPKSYQAFDKLAKAAAAELAHRRVIHRLLVGKTEWFSGRDPFVVLDEAVLPELATPLDEVAIKQLVTERARGYEPALKPWLKGALGRRVYEHAPSRGQKKKRYGTAPDTTPLLKPILAALAKSVERAEKQGISRAALLAALLHELGAPALPAPAAPAPGNGRSSARELFLDALGGVSAENPREALLSIGDVRRRAPLSKQEFDRVALELARERVISLHRHDYPASLTEAERELLVRDERGGYFVGIARWRTE